MQSFTRECGDFCYTLYSAMAWKDYRKPLLVKFVCITKTDGAVHMKSSCGEQSRHFGKLRARKKQTF